MSTFDPDRPVTRKINVGPAPKKPIDRDDADTRLQKLHEEYDTASDPRRAEIREEIRSIQRSVSGIRQRTIAKILQ